MIVPAAALVLGLAAWRAYLLGVSPAGILAAIATTALCMSFQSSPAIAPGAWILAACLVLVLDTGNIRQWWALGVIAVWTVALGTATIGALIVVLHAAGALLEERAWNYRTLRETLLALTACAIALITPPWLPSGFAGLRGFYLDTLAPGADRFLLWGAPISAPALGVFLIVVVAAARGMVRPHRACGGALFAGLLALTLVDARIAPFFAIACAPLVMRAITLPSFVVRARSPLIAATVAAGAMLVGTHSAIADRETAQMARLIATIRTAPGTHRLVCVHSTWCARVPMPAGTLAVYDAALQAKLLNGVQDAITAVRANDVDVLVADADMPITGLLRLQPDWIVSARDARTNRVLLLRRSGL